MNRLSFIRKVLYRLKRRYGSPVDVVWTLSSTVNRETGLKDLVHNFVRVQRMIVLPALIHREFFYDLTFIASNKNFTYGGHIDTTQRRFIVDSRDLPVDFEINPDKWFVYDGVRYNVKSAERFEENHGWLVVAKEDKAADASKHLSQALQTEISLTSEAEIVP
jgi:hypothetical protein